VCAEDGAYR